MKADFKVRPCIKPIILILAVILSFCSACADRGGKIPEVPPDGNGGGNSETVAPVPDSISEIPQSYYSVADEQGTLAELWYDTFESFSYGTADTPLKKRAIVYLPYG